MVLHGPFVVPWSRGLPPKPSYFAGPRGPHDQATKHLYFMGRVLAKLKRAPQNTSGSWRGIGGAARVCVHVYIYNYLFVLEDVSSEIDFPETRS